jgi:toxin YoeB
VNISFDEDAWQDYLYWQRTDRETLKKIHRLIGECVRTPFSGSGKPEALKHQLAGWWSRRIDDEHRLVYRVKGDDLQILQCRWHYGK